MVYHGLDRHFLDVDLVTSKVIVLLCWLCFFKGNLLILHFEFTLEFEFQNTLLLLKRLYLEVEFLFWH